MRRWDCSSLFKRSTLSWLDSDVEALYKGRSYEAQSSLDEETIKENAKAKMAAALAAASEALDKETPAGAASDEAIAWLMFNSNDWSVTYSVGDEYNPSEKTDGIVAEDVKITGEGTYTVSLDFTNTAAGYANSLLRSLTLQPMTRNAQDLTSTMHGSSQFRLRQEQRTETYRQLHRVSLTMKSLEI